ncbi:Malonate--CoA ligase [Abeliophyllum distichum]|uniref:Malonate--CoA ligase n=1 Tax=Abeliophyllum distichum TaxID=126358 RepID=A0ABD1VPL5_9LAMI
MFPIRPRFSDGTENPDPFGMDELKQVGASQFTVGIIMKRGLDSRRSLPSTYRREFERERAWIGIGIGIGLGLFCYLNIFSYNNTNHNFWSSNQFRSFSSGSVSNILMELVRAVASTGSSSPESIAIRADHKSYTYHQLISSARKISSLLCSADLKTTDSFRENKHLGGSRIGIVAKPSAEFVAGVLGTWFSGGVAVPLALSYPEAELLHVMNDSDVAMILSTEDHQELMASVTAKTGALLSLIPHVPSINSDSTVHDDMRNREMDGDKSFQGIKVSKEMNADDPALIIYTSGTTGKPKGVVHTHKGILAQVQMLTDAWGYISSDQFLHCLPLHHIQKFVPFPLSKVDF